MDDTTTPAPAASPDEATVTLDAPIQRGDEQIEDVAIGTGPLDASFKAINRMLQMDVKLESFSLNAVTDGEDAIGVVLASLAIARAERRRAQDIAAAARGH